MLYFGIRLSLDIKIIKVTMIAFLISRIIIPYFMKIIKLFYLRTNYTASFLTINIWIFIYLIIDCFHWFFWIYAIIWNF